VFDLRRILRERGVKGLHGKDIGVAAAPGKTPVFGWIRATLQQSPEVLEKSHGLDAAFFTRYLRSKVVLHSLLALLCCGILIPVYWTAGNKDLPVGDPLRTVGFQKLSMGNISTTDPWRFGFVYAGYVCSAVLTIGFALLDYRAFDEVCLPSGCIKWRLMFERLLKILILQSSFVVLKSRRCFRASRDPCNYAVIFQDIPPDFASEEQIYTYWNNLFPREVMHVHRACDAAKLVVNRNKWANAVARRERAEWEFVNNPKLAGSRPTHNYGACGCCKGSSAKVDSITFWTEQEQHYAEKINNLLTGDKYKRELVQLNAAIVVFKSKRSASIASQVMFASSDSQWRACRAPEPRAINFAGFAIGRKSKDFRLVITVASITALTLLWVVPVTFIQGRPPAGTRAKASTNNEYHH
jgi:Cytosolic domain of 10TM putative phosphate transporter/Late exocytosis, associated with Golgi transport